MATDAIVSLVVQTIGNLLIEEAKSFYRVGDKLKELQSELQAMRAFLKDAEARRHEKTGVRDWIAQIREAAYDAEDVLETYVLKVELKRQGGVKGALKRFASLPNEVLTLHKIGKDVDEIKNRLSKMAANSEALGIRKAMVVEDLDSWQARLWEQRQTFPHVVDHDLVGLESSIEKLAQDLVDEEKQFQVLSICGMGGLGKTTLARKVYQHGRVRKHFEGFAWAYVSQHCQRRDTWEGLLVSLSPSAEGVVKMKDQELVAELHEVLARKKCLVVLDDIWKTGTWDSLKAAFPCHTRSRIVLTSRNKDVALHADREGLLHEPQFLKYEESWELLQKIVFPRRNHDFKIEGKMEGLGKQMIKNCGGLPLAIRVLGGLLAKKCTLDRWQMIHDNIRSYITRGIGQQEIDSSVHNLLSLSYDELPSQLKNCFLYLALFPEDYEIPVDKLMKLWIVEGFMTSLQYDGEQTWKMEDVAKFSLDELIDRSMVLIGRTDMASSRVLTCRLHDVMREFCLLKAKEECFLQVIDSKDQGISVDASSLSSAGTCRRIIVHLSHDEKGYKIFSQHLIRNQLLRSLIYFDRVMDGCWPLHGTWGLLEASFKNFKVLRVLDLDRVNILGGKLPGDIGELVHLRYLSLYRAGIKEIPSSLGNLRLLESLDLRVEHAYVPNVLQKMQRLRHLYLPFECDDKTMLQLGSLKELETLVNFQHGVCDVRDLFHLTKLETLTVHRAEKRRHLTEIMPTTLGPMLKNLRSLTLGGTEEFVLLDCSLSAVPTVVGDQCSGFRNLFELGLHVKMDKLPDSNQFPQGITCISLWRCGLVEDLMPVLESLPMLRDLEIAYNAFIGREMVCSGNGFPQLHSLTLFDLANLEEWKVGEGAMLNLHSLGIGDCDELKALPEALKGIATMQKLDVALMPESFKEKLIPRGEDFYKIQHIPFVFHGKDK